MPALFPTTIQRVPPHSGDYYIHGGDAVFSVENTLFRVHRYFFTRDSSWFRDKLPYPAPPGETTKGSSDNLPLVLEDISKTDFERLLWVFYNPTYSLYDASVEEWASILKLAHLWDFTNVKALAIRGLESLGLQIPALQKVALYQKYDVDRNLLQASFATLTVRDEPITIDDGRELGLETALQVARARETARAPRRVGNPRSPISLAGVELDALINDIFTLSSPGAAREQPTTLSQTSTSDGTGTQTNTGPSSSNTAQGTGGAVNGSANGTTSGPPNSHGNGITPNYSQNIFSQNNNARANGRGSR